MIKKYITRTSGRDFDKSPINEKDLKIIIDVINNSPTSTNQQQFSAIIITDEKIKQMIAKNNWNQQHIIDSAAFIVFIADRTRVLEIIKHDMPEAMVKHEFFRATVDATIAATFTHDALMEMGYGVCFVGGVLGFAEELEKELNLPESSMVVVGLSFGKLTKVNDFKPKMNKVFINHYDKTQTKKEMYDYNEVMKNYYLQRNQNNDYITSLKQVSESEGFYGKAFSKCGNYIVKKIDNFK